MTRILVQRGSFGSSSSSPSRSSSSGSSSSARAEPQVTVPPASSAGKDEDNGEEVQDLVIGDEVSEFPGTDDSKPQSDDFLTESFHNEITDNKDVKEEVAGIGELMKGLSGLRKLSEKEVSKEDSSPTASGTSYPPPPPVPPPRPSAANLNSRNVSGNSNAVNIGSPRRGSAGHVSARTSPAGSRPSSPRSHNENEGYNSADEQSPCFVSSYDDLERERQFETDIRREKGYRVKIMVGDGNCLFRAVADQVYGDPELYDLTRQMCMDYMV
ncbi:hypothetical protein K1719_045337 [Acacia pycnantha]|nr:hypothetical protein K1719_045337 [Acacia pycnantha]